MQNIQHSMQKMNPSKGKVRLQKILSCNSLQGPDEEAINMWRADTIKAYSKSPLARNFEDVRLRKITELVFDTVTGFFPIVQGDDKDKSLLHDKIIVPAARLATLIHESPCVFRMDMPRVLDNTLEAAASQGLERRQNHRGEDR